MNMERGRALGRAPPMAMFIPKEAEKEYLAPLEGGDAEEREEEEEKTQGRRRKGDRDQDGFGPRSGCGDGNG